ncbi:hypothetical protein WJX84_006189 [Apatococcus fuscideae]|uniref:Uncharacterized protein n=1 Tax=Apatococcus fuscideae TaxID=2026836 RepID=A0AAW1SYV4_9CHLO
MASAAGQRTAGKETVEKNRELEKNDLIGSGADTSGKEYQVSDAEKKLGGEDAAEDQAFTGDKEAMSLEKNQASGLDSSAEGEAAAGGVAED